MTVLSIACICLALSPLGNNAMTTDLYDHDTPCSFYVEVPMWIAQDISCADLAAILEGGCDSGAYMPAVTYHKALQTMADHGADVLQCLTDTGTMPEIDLAEQSWAGMASLLLSTAVETWAASVSEDIIAQMEAMDRKEADEA